MTRRVLVFGLLGGALIALLELMQYHFLILRHSGEAYVGLVAALFAGVGLWLGHSQRRPRERVVVREVAVPTPVAGPFVRDEGRLASLRITRRELEILELIAEGLSNRDIAARVYLSENTVKTHASRLFDKLGARRRTQAVQRGKELGLLP